MLKLTTDKHEAWRGLSATAELLVLTLLVLNIFFYFLPSVEYIFLYLTIRGPRNNICYSGHVKYFLID